MLVLYKAVFLPQLIYNCEAWSNLDKDDYMMLQNSQLNCLRNVKEVSRAFPIAALYLDLGVLPIRYEIEMKQLFFLKGILSKDPCNPVKLAYEEMKKFGACVIYICICLLLLVIIYLYNAIIYLYNAVGWIRNPILLFAWYNLLHIIFFICVR